VRIIAPAAIAAMTDGQAIVSAAIEVSCSPVFRVWGGYEDITLGNAVFKGVGDRGLVTVSAAALGDSEQNVTLSLAGVDPDAVALLDASSVQRAGVALWRLIFDGSGRNLLDAQVYTRGRLDAIKVDETIGGLSSIIANVETAARGLGRSGQRMRTDADQRQIDVNDGGFRSVSFAGTKQLYWGGKRPSVVYESLPGSGGGGGADRFENYRYFDN
jgi:hypothetical protein